MRTAASDTALMRIQSVAPSARGRQPTLAIAEAERPLPMMKSAQAMPRVAMYLASGAWAATEGMKVPRPLETRKSRMKSGRIEAHDVGFVPVVADLRDQTQASARVMGAIQSARASLMVVAG